MPMHDPNLPPAGLVAAPSKASTVSRILPYLKALVGFITPGVVGLVAAVQDASPGGSAITAPEWVGIGAACILTGGAVFGTPNLDPAARHQDESVQPPPVD